MAVDAPQKPRRLALLVATSHHDDPKFDQLRGAVGDLRALEEVLRDPEIGDFGIVGSLMDQPKQAVEEAIADFFRGGRPQDVLLLYLSGHGVLSENRKHWFFVTSNSKRENLDATAIWDAWLKERMANSRSNSIVLMLDCCHSGAFIEGKLSKGEHEVHVEDHFEGAGTGRITLTASTALEYAFEAEQAETEDIGARSPGSVFTKHLVGGLLSRDADLDMDGRISLDELFRYVEMKLQAEVPKQTPGRGGQSFGPIYLARGRRTFLTPEVWTGLSSQNAAVRRGMVSVLTAVRESVAQQRADESEKVLAEIDGALERLAGQDASDAVRRTAGDALKMIRGGPRQPRGALRTPTRRPSFALGRAAFGSPDGDRAELRDPMSGLVEQRGESDASAIGIDPHGRSVRVIVGRKGTGKTLYLRRLQSAAYAERAIYADTVQSAIFRTELVVRMLDWYRHAATTVERWEELWHCAILRSVISHVLTVPELAQYVSTDVRDLGHELYPTFTTPEPVYQQVTDILDTTRTPHRLDAYLTQRGWGRLTRTLGETLRKTKPFCLYLDGLDEKFEHAPRQWLLCQIGLFKAVMGLRGDARLGSRLLVTVGLRDIAYSAIQSTEYATRYVDPAAIRILDWDRASIGYFLRHKVEALSDNHLMEPAAEDPIQAWLGLTRIHNEARGADESTEDYLLRHTRLIPRDVVVLGNSLCSLVEQAHELGQPFLSQVDLRDVVARAARGFGREELRAVANHLTSETMPQGAAVDGYADFYTGETAASQPYQAAVAEQLTRLLGTLEHDRFPQERLEALEAAVRPEFDAGIEPVDVLWRHGLIGYIEGPVRTGRATFYSPTREDRLTLPRNKPGYGLHAILLDAVDELRGVGAPVVPF